MQSKVLFLTLSGLQIGREFVFGGVMRDYHN
jgi:hypothetical protein